MKKFSSLIVLPIFTLVLVFYSCSSENRSSLPSKSSYGKIKQNTLNSITTNFHVSGTNPDVHLTSPKGVKIYFDTNNLTLNGNPVTGSFDVKYIEIFDNATMVATGKHTMGKMPDGKKAMLVSGGEFYINITKNGQQLELSTPVTLIIPTSLSDDTGGNPDMTLWNLAEQDSVWVQEDFNQVGLGGVFLNDGMINTGIDDSTYIAYLNDFGWTNVDCFYEDQRPKTTILASVPTGYTNQNCDIYLHYDGNGNALAELDTYDGSTGLFSEHYGQIPIGLACHIIFASESQGQWRYAIKPATITAGAIYDFTLSETIVCTQDQMIAAIKALP